MSESYDTDNIFAKILRGELPAHKVYEDDSTLAFMDILPLAEGHTLVIPKAPSRNLLDIAEDDLCALARTVQRVARAVKTAMNARGVRIMQFNEAAAGQEVFHTHFHVIPVRADGKVGPRPTEMAPPEKLAAAAERIRAALNG